MSRKRRKRNGNGRNGVKKIWKKPKHSPDEPAFKPLIRTRRASWFPAPRVLPAD